jgi:hypothetical protein
MLELDVALLIVDPKASAEDLYVSEGGEGGALVFLEKF